MPNFVILRGVPNFGTLKVDPDRGMPNFGIQNRARQFCGMQTWQHVWWLTPSDDMYESGPSRSPRVPLVPQPAAASPTGGLIDTEGRKSAGRVGEPVRVLRLLRLLQLPAGWLCGCRVGPCFHWRRVCPPEGPKARRDAGVAAEERLTRCRPHHRHHHRAARRVCAVISKPPAGPRCWLAGESAEEILCVH